MTEFANLFSALDDPRAVAPKLSGQNHPARRHSRHDITSW